MKFCPQCGTTFEPDGRFCQECGFDRSTVEPTVPENTEVPGVINSETWPASGGNASHTVTEAKPICPQCGSLLDMNDRFCQECGFDTVKTQSSPNVIPALEQPPAIEVTAIPPEPVEAYDIHPDPVAETVLPPTNTQFCPQCGSGITPGERFCQECGFDTSGTVMKTEANPEPVSIPPLAGPQHPPQPENVPPPPEPVPVTRVTGTRTEAFGEAAAQPKKKKNFIRVALIVFLLGLLGAAGWFVYNNYIASPEEKTTDSVITMGIPENTEIETDAINAEVTEQAEAAAPEQSETKTKPISRMDQELARQKAKETNQPSQPAVEDERPVITPHITANEIIVKVLLEVGKKEEPKNKNPRNPAKLSIQKRCMIVRITTDHYNDGMGTPGGGTITIKDRNDNTVGSYKAHGKTGKNGTPSAKWVATPNVILEKGTYFISDSEPSTWSKTFIGSNGFILVEGYEVE